MSALRAIALLGLIVIVISICGVSVVSAADPPKPAILFGTVDIDKAYIGYEKSATIKTEMKAAYDRAQLRLDLMKANKLLAQSEIEELVTLSTKPKQEAADKTRMDALLNDSKTRDQELQTLEQKQDATDAEKTRRQELLDQRKKSEEGYRKAYEQLQTELNTKEAEFLSAARKDIVDAVSAIAKEKAIHIVFNRSIGVNDFVIYSALDITEDVIKKLNKK
jgi:Skp family chaperone for outer membrane proteins